MRFISINPKQLDRFRDRFTVAGAKDDSRDALVLAHSLKTDAHAFRRLHADDPVIIELREWSRLADDLKEERNRLANRVRQQLWRYYPQMLELGDDIAAQWLLELWQQAPTPAKAAELSEAHIARLLQSPDLNAVPCAHQKCNELFRPASILDTGKLILVFYLRGLRSVTRRAKTSRKRLRPPTEGGNLVYST